MNSHRAAHDYVAILIPSTRTNNISWSEIVHIDTDMMVVEAQFFKLLPVCAKVRYTPRVYLTLPTAPGFYIPTVAM